MRTVATIVLLAACGPPQSTRGTGSGSGSADVPAPAAGAQDQALEIDELTVYATYFDPEALPAPKSRRAAAALDLLAEGKTAEARAALTEGPASRGEIPAELAYAAAWIDFREGRAAEAFAQMSAVVGGSIGPDSGKLRPEVLLFASRGDVAPADALAMLERLEPSTRPGQAALIGGLLGRAYLAAGRYQRGLELIELRFAAGDDPALRGELRWEQADIEHRLYRPAAAAAHAIEAWQIAAAGGVDADGRTRAAQRLYTLAAVYQRIYETSLDPTAGTAAGSLFGAYLAVPAAASLDDARRRARGLDELRADPQRQRAGLHDALVIQQQLAARQQELGVCYERELQRDAGLAGTVAVRAELAAGGRITAVATEPAPGDGGLPGVARCIAAALTTWTFPARTRPGTTRLRFRLALQRA